MDVKCAFLNGELEEMVYVEQPPGFLNENYPNHYYILDKVVYGLKLSSSMAELGGDFYQPGSLHQVVTCKIRNGRRITSQGPNGIQNEANTVLGQTYSGYYSLSTNDWIINVSSRPDIFFAVCCCARFQANPRDPHMTPVKNILRYLKRSSSLGIWYPSNSVFFMQAFLDAYLGGCGLDHKRSSGRC
ncbi:uncharacterized protein LOC111905012 [Lactuca sativa]|uniref:uncharacterized protein LOC111905012 n=1 Tax=Lactuca sativa TaxID=4236 RepID=UPI000CD92149|nr:uncharacterized protein LOC111905012 [Lactuca sativa]